MTIPHNPGRRSIVLAGLAAPALLNVGRAFAAEPAIVEIATGRLSGLQDNGAVSFKGIPYAADTSGRNRFMAPRPVTPWTGVREATAFGPRSPQGDGGPPPAAGSAGAPVSSPMGENCCVLNVYTPDLNRNARRPVMFWIHGGGLRGGSGEVDGANLAKFGDVVVVTVNHRLNFFGYANLGHLHPDFAESNAAGQLDLVAALNWVRTNISVFGGDPGNVTLFGQSGGGSKIMILQVMPRADGLFRRYINMSGPAAFDLSPPADQEPTIAAIMRELEIAPRDVRKLQELPTAQILAAQARAEDRMNLDQLRALVDGRIITCSPLSREGLARLTRKPAIMSATATEAATYVPNTAANRDVTVDQLKRRIAEQFKLDDAGAAAVYEGYRQDGPQRSPYEILLVAASEAQVRVPIRRAAEAVAEAGGQPVYLMDFNYKTGPLGPPHAADVAYAFGNQATGRNPRTGADAAAVAKNEMSAFVSFARNGVPTVPGIPQWTPYNTRQRPVLVMEEQARLVNDFRSGDRRTSAPLRPQSIHEMLTGALERPG